MANGSWLMAQGSCIKAQGSGLMANRNFGAGSPRPRALAPNVFISQEPCTLGREPWALSHEPLTIKISTSYWIIRLYITGNMITQILNSQMSQIHIFWKICLGNVSWILLDSQREFGIFNSTTKGSQGPNNPGIMEFGDFGPSNNKTKNKKT